jgi:hypothetical protein
MPAIAIRSALFAACAVLVAATAEPAQNTGAGPVTQSLDYQRRLDVNRLSLFVTNVGSIGYDLAAANSGLEYPKFTGRTALYASGLWACGKIGGQTRVTVAEYSFEWQPGGAPGGIPDNPNNLDHIVYKTSASDPQSAGGSPDPIGQMDWSQYVSGAAPHGAPTKTIRVDDTSTPAPGDSIDVLGPDLPGQIATWCIYNDLDPSDHTNDAGSTLPLGLEVRQTIYGFHSPSTVLEDVAFVRFEIRNAGAATIDSTYFGFWSDPDLGGAGDDLVGWDGTRGFGYVYNATNNDNVYGSAPPALGFVLLESPVPASANHPFGAAGFSKYINGTDPQSSFQSASALHGLQIDGNPWIDPATLQPTAFPFSGDPLTGTGWLDTNPSDRRMLVSVGPLTLAPGATTTVRYAIVVGQGTDRLSSIAKLRCIVDALRSGNLASDCTGSVPALATLVESNATSDAVTLSWYVAGATGESYALERRVDGSEWNSLATVSADGEGFVRYVDRAVVPGARNTYRLVGSGTPQGEVTVSVPASSETPALAVGARFVVGGTPMLELALPSDGEVRYDVYSLGGRRLLGGSLGVLAAGHRTAPIAGSLAPGVYLVRVRQGAAEARAKALVLRP